MRLAILDSDSGFVRVLVEAHAEDIGWQYRRSRRPRACEEFVAMRVNALVVDLALLGPGRVGVPRAGRRRAARPRRGRVHGPLERRPASARPAARGRRLGHEALPPRGGARARGGRGAPAPPASARVETGPLVAGELEIRADQFQAFVGGRSVDLTRREFEVLQLLADARGKVLQREEIYQRVWGYAMAHGDRSVDVFVRKLRQKLETASPDWRYIHTHFGVGYRFDPERRGGPDAEEPLVPPPSDGDPVPLPDEPSSGSLPDAPKLAALAAAL